MCIDQELCSRVGEDGQVVRACGTVVREGVHTVFLGVAEW